MRMTHQGLRGVICLLAVLTVLAAGIASARFVPALQASASHAVSHTQLAANAPRLGTHC